MGQAFRVTKGGPVEHRPELRLSQADRDKAAAVMAKFCGEGRLTLDEFSQRIEVVLAARTQADLDGVMSDLPTTDVQYSSPIPASGWQVAVLSGSSRKGRWRPKARFRALAMMGGLQLDLRNAEIDGREITITAVALMGGIDIVVPEGVLVHLSGFSLLGGKDEKIANVPVLPGSPVIKVRAFPVMGGVTVRTKRSRNRLIDGVRAALDASVGDRSGSSHERTGSRGGASTSPRGGFGHRDQILDAHDALALASDILEQVFPRDSRRRDRWSSPTSPHGMVTIQFCDVSGFTEMTERYGDRECQRLLGTFFDIVRGQVSAHGGHEVKHQGDEAMLAFGGAAQAVHCAIDIQKSLAQYNAASTVSPIRAHIGLHTGEAIRDRGDFLGRTVILASRITDEARADEILVSAVLRGLASGSSGLSFGPARTVALQGVSEPQELYPVLWT